MAGFGWSSSSSWHGLEESCMISSEPTRQSLLRCSIDLKATLRWCCWWGDTGGLGDLGGASRGVQQPGWDKRQCDRPAGGRTQSEGVPNSPPLAHRPHPDYTKQCSRSQITADLLVLTRLSGSKPVVLNLGGRRAIMNCTVRFLKMLGIWIKETIMWICLLYPSTYKE